MNEERKEGRNKRMNEVGGEGEGNKQEENLAASASSFWKTPCWREAHLEEG